MSKHQKFESKVAEWVSVAGKVNLNTMVKYTLILEASDCEEEVGLVVT